MMLKSMHTHRCQLEQKSVLQDTSQHNETKDYWHKLNQGLKSISLVVGSSKPLIQQTVNHHKLRASYRLFFSSLGYGTRQHCKVYAGLPHHV